MIRFTLTHTQTDKHIYRNIFIKWYLIPLICLEKKTSEMYLWWMLQAWDRAASALPAVLWHWDSLRWGTWCRSQLSAGSPARRRRRLQSWLYTSHRQCAPAEEHRDPVLRGLRSGRPASTTSRQTTASGPQMKHRKPEGPISNAGQLGVPTSPAGRATRLCWTTLCTSSLRSTQMDAGCSVHLLWPSAGEAETREEVSRTSWHVDQGCWIWLSCLEIQTVELNVRMILGGKKRIKRRRVLHTLHQVYGQTWRTNKLIFWHK